MGWSPEIADRGCAIACPTSSQQLPAISLSAAGPGSADPLKCLRLAGTQRQHSAPLLGDLDVWRGQAPWRGVAGGS
jgi:hypothetical protein